MALTRKKRRGGFRPRSGAFSDVDGVIDSKACREAGGEGLRKQWSFEVLSKQTLVRGGGEKGGG